MTRPQALAFAMLLVIVALSGCAAKKEKKGDNEADPSTFGEADKYDHAIGNKGHHVTGNLKGSVSTLQPSAAELSIADETNSDADGPSDRADFVLEAKETGLTVNAKLKRLTTAEGALLAGNFGGGTAHNILINGDSGIGFSDLPKAKAYLFAVGYAQLQVNGNDEPEEALIFVAVTQGIRDDQQKPLTQADAHDLEMHILLPGSLIPGASALSFTADGFLYYYFEQVSIDMLTAAQKATVGSSLGGGGANRPPVAAVRILVNGVVAHNGTIEGNQSLSVKLDGSNSTDPDGRITAYAWAVYHLNLSGEFEHVNKLQSITGKNVTYNFTSPSTAPPLGGMGTWKFVLRVLDDRQTIDESEPYFFYVDYHLRKLVDLPDTYQGGYTKCKTGLNCDDQTVPIAKNVTHVKITWTKNGTLEPVENHLDFYSPTAPKPGSEDETDPQPTPNATSTTKTLDLTHNAFWKGNNTETGNWVVYYWFKGGVDVSYWLDLRIMYNPPSA